MRKPTDDASDKRLDDLIRQEKDEGLAYFRRSDYRARLDARRMRKRAVLSSRKKALAPILAAALLVSAGGVYLGIRALRPASARFTRAEAERFLRKTPGFLNAAPVWDNSLRPQLDDYVVRRAARRLTSRIFLSRYSAADLASGLARWRNQTEAGPPAAEGRATEPDRLTLEAFDQKLEKVLRENLIRKFIKFAL
jgi:hypothetical protein